MALSDIQTRLFDMATHAMQNAYNPYSRYSVGAALQTIDGITTAGCNVENVSFRLTLCAEANAIGSLITEHGLKTIDHILIVASGESFPTPCGACRQIITEFSTPETLVHLARARVKEEGFDVRTYRISSLLPLSFTQSILNDQKIKIVEPKISQQTNS